MQYREIPERFVRFCRKLKCSTARKMKFRGLNPVRRHWLKRGPPFDVRVGLYGGVFLLRAQFHGFRPAIGRKNVRKVNYVRRGVQGEFWSLPASFDTCVKTLAQAETPF